eukprot:TRINITY_DN1090_c0_g1_i1.p1 TRINITY_DN1090_c0_g1~~TRINITY_DN1090_c0_g1_i1.p1  ORF type:complete len:124 (+),score=5.32 TRINITY_DN1090_c0_g1_i1:152-523(+)
MCIRDRTRSFYDSLQLFKTQRVANRDEGVNIASLVNWSLRVLIILIINSSPGAWYCLVCHDYAYLATSVTKSRHVRRPVSYTHLRAHETPEHLVCRLLLEKKKKKLTNLTLTHNTYHYIITYT